jgi:hypothetical protein
MSACIAKNKKAFSPSLPCLSEPKDVTADVDTISMNRLMKTLLGLYSKRAGVSSMIKQELIMDKKNNLPDKKTIDDVIPISRIIELRKRGNSYTEIGKILGCTKQNVELRLRPFKAEIEALESFKEQKADVLAVYQLKLLNSLTEADIKNIPPGSRLTGFGILYDKERLERDKSTANVSVHELQETIISSQQAREEARARREAAEQRKAELLKMLEESQRKPE